MATLKAAFLIKNVSPGDYQVRVALDDASGTVELTKASTPIKVEQTGGNPVAEPPLVTIEP